MRCWQLGPKRLKTRVTLILLSATYPSSWPRSITLSWSLNQLFEMVTSVDPCVTSKSPSLHWDSVLWSIQTLEEPTMAIASTSNLFISMIFAPGAITLPGDGFWQWWMCSPWIITLVTWSYMYNHSSHQHQSNCRALSLKKFISLSWILPHGAPSTRH